MRVFSSKEKTKFSLWCHYFLAISGLLIGSSVSGFTAASLGEKNSFNIHRNHIQGRCGRRHPQRPAFQHTTKERYSASTTFTKLRLSFSIEVPIAGDLVSTYAHCLKYHYFPTQSITNAVLTVVGDGLAQTHEENQRQSGNDFHSDGDSSTTRIINSNYYDPKRGLVYFFKGLGSGIMWAWWFDMAEVWSMELTQSFLAQTNNGFNEAVNFATKASEEVLSIQGQTIRTGINIFLEQFLVCPILFSFWDIPVTSVMRGSHFERVPYHVQEKLVPLLVANAKVWTLANIITYNIPLEYRLLFTSAASIVSESINSGITSKQIEAAPPALATLANKNSPLISSEKLTAAAAATMTATVSPLVNSSGGKNMTLLEQL